MCRHKLDIPRFGFNRMNLARTIVTLAAFISIAPALAVRNWCLTQELYTRAMMVSEIDTGLRVNRVSRNSRTCRLNFTDHLGSFNSKPGNGGQENNEKISINTAEYK